MLVCALPHCNGIHVCILVSRQALTPVAVNLRIIHADVVHHWTWSRSTLGTLHMPGLMPSTPIYVVHRTLPRLTICPHSWKPAGNVECELLKLRYILHYPPAQVSQRNHRPSPLPSLTFHHGVWQLSQPRNGHWLTAPLPPMHPLSSGWAPAAS